MRTQYHFWPSGSTSGETQLLDAWEVTRLIELSRDLPVESVRLDSLSEIDTVYWFDDREQRPTIRRVAEHMRLVEQVDPGYPIILGPDGRVMDGMHRIARALLADETEIVAVRFPTAPEPDYRDCRPEDLPYLRRGLPEDAAVLGEIEQAAGAAFAEAGHPELAAMDAISAAEARAAIEAGEVTVAEVRGRAVGWLLVDPHGDERLIDELAVLPELQGRGIGSLLVRNAALEARLEGCATVILNTQVDVDWNRPWYERRGFEVIDTAQWTPQMAAITQSQERSGLDWRTRVHMRRRL